MGYSLPHLAKLLGRNSGKGRKFAGRKMSKYFLWVFECLPNACLLFKVVTMNGSYKDGI